MISNLLKNNLMELGLEKYISFVDKILLIEEESIKGKLIDSILFKSLDLSDYLDYLYHNRTIVLSVEFMEYPNLFNRRIHIPTHDNLFEMVIAILASLRITEPYDFYIEMDRDYQMNELDISYDKKDFIIHYATWSFQVKYLSIDDTKDVSYLVSDGVGYGICELKKEVLVSMLEESILLSLDTKNPIMDDENFEFYSLDIDELNKNSVNDFNNLIENYKNKIDKNLNVL